MEDISLTETETRYFSDLFVCCDVDKTGKIPVLKATELFRSANLSNDAIRQITSISGIPQKALHISRTEFYSCLKLIAAYQASIPLRSEIITSTTINLPLPRFSWKESPPIPTRMNISTSCPTTSAIAIGSDTINNITGTNSTNNYMASSITSTSSGGSSGTGGGINSDLNGLIINEEKRKNSLGNNPLTNDTTNRQWREIHSPDLIEIARSSAVNAATAAETANSDLHSTDSEVEHNESTSGRVNRRHRGGSPEAWSTNSDSPTPTNSVAERPWAKDTMWQGLLGDEHRQLLGTEEESSDRHSSDDDNETDIETIYQITTEQREYYHKQFKAVQPDPKGLLSGHVARVFFEKSRIPVEELRHIWQLCDVTRDGALSLAEFTAAMHLVVLRRNNIPLPSVLPTCLHPTILCGSNDSSRNNSSNKHPTEPPEADLLHLDDDDDDDDDRNEDIDDDDDENISMVAVDGNSASSTITSGTASSLISSKTSNDTTIGPNDKEFKRLISRSDKNSTKLNTLSNNSQSTSNKQLDKTLTGSPPSTSMVHTKNRSISNTPPAEPTTPPVLRSKEIPKDWTNQSKEWTKFTESPTSNVSSPGPKPVNFDMQRTAQAVVSDPQILHPVPLRVTPVGTEVIDDESSRLSRKSENLVYDVNSGVLRENESSPKQQSQQQHRDSLQNNDLRAIQRPQAKKLPTKNIGAIPPPPQRESSIGGIESGDILPTVTTNSITNSSGGGGIIVINNLSLSCKKDPPPLPPPRPHRHARSSSLDLNKLKMSGNPSQPEMTTQASLDVQTDSSNIAFADFTQFPESSKMIITEQLHTLVGNDSSYSTTTQSTTTIPPRPTISTLQTNHRASAFEVYRKPNTPRNSQSPDSQLQFQPLPPLPTTLTQNPPVPPPPTSVATTTTTVNSGIIAAASSLVPSTNSSSSSTSINAINNSGLEYDKRVNQISETLRHISLKNDKNITDVLRHLREQNVLLLRLCNDLSDELLTVQQRKEELRCKLESQRGGSVAGGSSITTITGGGGGGASGSISSNVTGGSSGSGNIHSNV